MAIKKPANGGTASSPEFDSTELPTKKESPISKSSPPKELTLSEKIWASICNRPIQMFGLPNQFVHMHVSPFTAIDPDVLYLKVNSTAAIPQLEASVAPEFKMEIGERYVEISLAKTKVNLNLGFQNLGG